MLCDDVTITCVLHKRSIVQQARDLLAQQLREDEVKRDKTTRQSSSNRSMRKARLPQACAGWVAAWLRSTTFHFFIHGVIHHLHIHLPVTDNELEDLDI
jgi:hypothetical protein